MRLLLLAALLLPGGAAGAFFSSLWSFPVTTAPSDDVAGTNHVETSSAAAFAAGATEAAGTSPPVSAQLWESLPAPSAPQQQQQTTSEQEAPSQQQGQQGAAAASSELAQQRKAAAQASQLQQELASRPPRKLKQPPVPGAPPVPGVSLSVEKGPGMQLPNQQSQGQQAAAAPAYVNPASTEEAIAGTTLDLRSLQNYPMAVCNDGTPGGYYWSPGTDSSLWIVYLQGGYWCTNRLTCHGRMSDVDQASSQYWQTTTAASGIFSRTPNNSFAAANLVYVRYCSSDACTSLFFLFFSESLASDSRRPPHRDGRHGGFQRAVQGHPHRLRRVRGPADQHGPRQRGAGALRRLLRRRCVPPPLCIAETCALQLIYSSSPTARGAMVHLDNIVALMAPQGISVRGLLDSGLWVDFTPMSNGGMGGTLLNQAVDVYGFANTSSVIPADCAAAYPGEEYRCLFGQYRMPFVKSDYFLSQSQFDDFQTNYDCSASPIIDTQIMQGNFDAPYNQLTTQCFNNLQLTIRSVLQNLPTATQTGSGIFSSTCSSHCTTTGADYWTITVGDATLSSLVAAWWFGHDTPRTISACQGTPCMADCIPEEQRFPQGFGATENVAR